MRYCLIALLLAGCFGHAGLRTAHAEASFACVRCTGPAQTYRCRAMSDETVPAEAVRYFCMAQIAREHVHESCTALRNGVNCNGMDVSYVYQDGVADQPVESDRAAGEEAKKPGLADMTLRAGQAVGETAAKAGQAVTDATRRTLKCLGTALNGC
jgi:hypothetical protein